MTAHWTAVGTVAFVGIVGLEMRPIPTLPLPNPTKTTKKLFGKFCRLCVGLDNTVALHQSAQFLPSRLGAPVSWPKAGGSTFFYHNRQ